MPEQKTQSGASEQRKTSDQPQNQQQSLTPQNTSGSQSRREPGNWQPFGFSLTPNDVMRMSPFALMRRLSQEFDRSFTSTSSGWGDGGFWTPAIEVSQQEGNYTISAELPGIDPNNVKIDIEQNAIVLRGERESNVNDERGGFHHTERSYGSFYRTVPLPQGAEPDQARARFNNGVLEITVPVKEQASQRRQIPIESSAGTSSGSSTPSTGGAASRSQTTNNRPEGGRAA